MGTAAWKELQQFQNGDATSPATTQSGKTILEAMGVELYHFSKDFKIEVTSHFGTCLSCYDKILNIIQ